MEKGRNQIKKDGIYAWNRFKTGMRLEIKKKRIRLNISGRKGMEGSKGQLGGMEWEWDGVTRAVSEDS